MKKKKASSPISSNVKSEVVPAQRRTLREGLTRVGVVTSPIKGKDTHAKQWNRWTP